MIRCPACREFIIVESADCPSRDVHAAAAEATIEAFALGKRKGERMSESVLEAAADLLSYPVGHGAGTRYRAALKKLRVELSARLSAARNERADPTAG